VVLLHGLASSFEHNWREPGWFDLLTEAGRDVIEVELPGHGKGPHETDAAAFEDVPGEVARRIDRAGSGPVDGVGFSLGGHTLLTIATRAPERFRRLAILGVGDSALQPPTPEGRSVLDPRSSDLDPSRPTRTYALADAFDRALADGAESNASIEPEPPAQLFWRLARSAGNDPAVLARFLRRPTHALDGLDRITCPVLVVIGERDQFGPADQLVAALPSARLVTLRGTDHFTTTSDYRCLDAVLGFLDE
jgi:pimeloyl-ACP methyl ester carboxylesterase